MNWTAYVSSDGLYSPILFRRDMRSEAALVVGGVDLGSTR